MRPFPEETFAFCEHMMKVPGPIHVLSPMERLALPNILTDEQIRTFSPTFTPLHLYSLRFNEYPLVSGSK